MWRKWGRNPGRLCRPDIDLSMGFMAWEHGLGGKGAGRNCTFEELLTFFVRAGKTNIARRGGPSMESDSNLSTL